MAEKKWPKCSIIKCLFTWSKILYYYCDFKVTFHWKTIKSQNIEMERKKTHVEYSLSLEKTTISKKDFQTLRIF